VNLDRKKSRSEGRKIPRRFSVPNVKLSELVEACKELQLEFRVEEKKYPRCWWEEGGRIFVRKNGSKTALMIKIAQKIVELREEKKRKEKKEKKVKKR
jgi:signal recognition particle subunit SRP19